MIEEVLLARHCMSGQIEEVPVAAIECTCTKPTDELPCGITELPAHERSAVKQLVKREMQPPRAHDSAQQPTAWTHVWVSWFKLMLLQVQ
jgi:hypothetical protein